MNSGQAPTSGNLNGCRGLDPEADFEAKVEEHISEMFESVKAETVGVAA